ncbi:Ces3 [Cordylochernes scorpioides]|uniref:Ces3 n=1 Tax=Cordylochernes scorpioides TaxID=51811 RepID=A0ABY6LS94_9ARAC|nr:Ces3 [Cordylochernes scorpioides]
MRLVDMASARTISRRLIANGLHSCRPLRRLPLTPPNRRQRLEWCRARSTWMTEWHRVVFLDEPRFCLSSDSRHVRVWRRRGERSNPAAIVERPTVRQRGIMVWGAIAYDSRSPLLRIQGTMTAQRYVDDVLRPVTLPYLKGVPNALYQQDNARPHTARISQQALQDVQMLPWPPYSPDLSPIEHVWDIIGRRLHALPQPRSEDELWQMATNSRMLTGMRWLFAAVWLLVAVSGSRLGSSRVVTTRYGSLRGTLAAPGPGLSPVEAFLGLAYAAAPVGSLRFMPPVSPAHWTGVRTAAIPGPPCPHPSAPPGSNFSEDCLYLNIYAPATGWIMIYSKNV